MLAILCPDFARRRLLAACVALALPLAPARAAEASAPAPTAVPSAVPSAVQAGAAGQTDLAGQAGPTGTDSAAQQAPVARRAPRLVSDDPNMLGVAWDGYDGHAYMDFNISVRYPIAYDWVTDGRAHYSGMWLPYFSFGARASQYFDRRSAPVVTKRFNPKLMVRHYQSEPPAGKELWLDDGALDYQDFGYAHESNGQYVNSPEAFNAVAANFASTAVAQDYVHRGWDYLDFRRHSHFREDRRAWLDVELKYFINHGLAQTNITEIYPWEAHGKITHIGQVDGVRVTAGFDLGEDWFKNARLTWYTGYRDLGRYNSVRLESTFEPLSRFFGVPIVLWAQSGYDNNVAHFYQHSWYAGAAFSFETGR